MDLDRPPITLPLRYDEAVVLADMLGRWEQDGTLESLPFDDQAEQRVLWDLAAALEPLVDEAFSTNYAEVLAAARDNVRDPAN
jgi:hypothetical protein